MAKRGGGSTINLGSIYGNVALDFHVYDGTDITMPAAYAAIKGGIASYSRYLASYWGRQGERVNTVCPGGIFDNQPERFAVNYAGRTPLGRMGTPEDIDGPLAFLASDSAAYVTGVVLMMDGAWTAI